MLTVFTVSAVCCLHYFCCRCCMSKKFKELTKRWLHLYYFRHVLCFNINIGI